MRKVTILQGVILCALSVFGALPGTDAPAAGTASSRATGSPHQTAALETSERRLPLRLLEFGTEHLVQSRAD